MNDKNEQHVFMTPTEFHDYLVDKYTKEIDKFRKDVRDQMHESDGSKLLIKTFSYPAIAVDVVSGELTECGWNVSQRVHLGDNVLELTSLGSR